MQSVFGELERLEQSTRSMAAPDKWRTLPHRQLVRDEQHTPQYAHGQVDQAFQSQHDPIQPEIQPSEPMVFDSFDESLMRLPDHDGRQVQAQLGRNRLSLLPAQVQMPQQHNEHQFYHNEDAYDRPVQVRRAGVYTPSSSSVPALPSSPTINASQRQRSPRTNCSTLSAHKQPMYDRMDDAGRPPVGGRRSQQHTNFSSSRPIVQGIELIPVHELSDRFRPIFPFPLFNAVQSKCFRHAYESNDNLVVSSPTGSGKTAIFELTICRIVNLLPNGSFKIVYMAPTKSLCAERKRDWQKKFAPLSLSVEEMTGDSDATSLRAVQSSDVIITTPEKWDSMTRKWKDHQRLVQLVKLFMIDEVHILNKDRGAALEAVVSRMKSLSSDIRFIALSATVPNSQDIATWLGQNPSNQDVPAIRERFGEEFRPVKLQKHICGYQTTSNDFAFDTLLTKKLPEVISKFSHRKPIMIFCFTRNSCKQTANFLADWWRQSGGRDRYWNAPRKAIAVHDKGLRDIVDTGVAAHHAGIDADDRASIEKAYLSGDINVICCTSTLAVGINLPCHMVIIKNTVGWEGGANHTQEYSDLDVMQMMGRAGRPQFDDSAVAVIMTKMQKYDKYDKMMSGQEILESRLHTNLIEHLNAEIGLGTIPSLQAAKKWLSGTFMYVRLKDNPDHYKIEGDTAGRNLDERLEKICTRNVELLGEQDLITTGSRLRTTEFGDAMARYYVDFETMKVFLALPPKAKISEILSALAQAHEFREMRMRVGEKQIYKEVNKSPSIRFPIKVDLALPAHKVSLIIQSVLGGIDTLSQDQNHKFQYSLDQAIIWQHIRRLIRCIVDCQTFLGDSTAIRNALMLVCSLGARVWDDSPLHLQQIAGLGAAGVKRLIGADIRSIENLESTEPSRIETVLSRNPPFGQILVKRAKDFPKLAVTMKMADQPIIKSGEHVTIKVKAEIGFLNERVPSEFQKKSIYVCVLAETSDGNKIHFGKYSAQKLGKAQAVTFEARLTSANQCINVYVACEEIAGTLQQASLKPGLPPSAFPVHKDIAPPMTGRDEMGVISNTSKARVPPVPDRRRIASGDSDEWGDGNIDDSDLARVETTADDFRDVDDYEHRDSNDHHSMAKQTAKAAKKKAPAADNASNYCEPRRLDNGNWECNHPCKNRLTCKHLCCKDGTENKPKVPKSKDSKANQSTGADSTIGKTQLKLDLSVRKPIALAGRTKGSAEHIDLSQTSAHDHVRPTKVKPRPGLGVLHQSHNTSQGSGHAQVMKNREADYSFASGTQPQLSFLTSDKENDIEMQQKIADDDLLDSTAFDDMDLDTRLPDCVMSGDEFPESSYSDDDEEMLDALLIGAEDSQNLRSGEQEPVNDDMLLEYGSDGMIGMDKPQDTAMETQSFDFETATSGVMPGPSVGDKHQSIFLADNISTPAKNVLGQRLPRKRSFEEVNEPASQAPDSPSKKPKVTREETLTTPRRDASCTPPADPEEEEHLMSADSPRRAELRAWVFAQFGNSVELV